MDHWFGQTPIVETLLLRKHCCVAVSEMDVFPPKPLTSLVVPISKDFRTSYARVREEINERAVATSFDRSFSILTEVVDRGAGLLVNEPGELLAVFGRPGLLVAALATSVVGDRFIGISEVIYRQST